MYVASHPELRRPDTTLAGFLLTLAKIPMRSGVRRELDMSFSLP